MHIEIRGVGFINKGAELMLRAALQKAQSVYPDARYVMAPGTDGSGAPYRDRAQLGLYQKAWQWRYGVQWGDLAGLAPARLREKFGVVLDSEIDVVLDAAGFAYSDQWGSGNTRELARATRRWKRRGTKVILLPQAFGPFGSDITRKAAREFVANADLVCARDRISYQNLVEVAGEQDKIRIYPDFTNLVRGTPPPGFDPDTHRFCIIPNHRMVDKTDNATAQAYLPLLAGIASHLKARDAKPFLLVHGDEGDRRLAERVSAEAGGVPVMEEPDPLAIKGILGQCRGTLSSRFHGLVSALSQGVPSLATSWSHKYEMLFADYGVTDGLLDVTADADTVRGRLDALLDPDTFGTTRHTLLDHAARIKRDAESMWDDVFALCDNVSSSRRR